MKKFYLILIVLLFGVTSRQVIAQIPYLQNFEDSVENSHWTLIGQDTNRWYIGSAVNTTPGGNNALYVSNDYGLTNAYTSSMTAGGAVSISLAYRDINFGISYPEYDLSFKYHNMGEVNPEADYLKVYIAPSDDVYNSQFLGGYTPYEAVLLGTFNNQSEWADFTIRLGHEFQGLHRLYFVWRNNNLNGENPPAAVDDITIEGVACGTPLDLALDGVTSTTIAVHFTPAMSADSSWQLVIVPIGSTLEEGESVIVSTANHVFTNLNPDSYYSIYVRNLCDSSSSDWTQPLNVRTSCGQLIVPYYEDFSSFNLEPSSCWSRYNTRAADVFAGAPLTPTTDGWRFNCNNTFPLGHPAFECGDTSSHGWLVSPALNLSPLLYPTLSFKLALTDNEGDWPITETMAHRLQSRFMVIVSPDSGTTWSESNATVWSNDTLDDYVFSDIFYQGEIIDLDLSAYANQTVKVAFYAESGPIDWCDIHIADFSINERPECARPDSLKIVGMTNSTVELTWVETGDATSWDVAYVPAGQSPDGPQAVVEQAMQMSHILAGLTDSTTYDIYVRSDCGLSKSIWIGPKTVIVGHYNMEVVGTNELTACNIHIYDDGGPNGIFTAGANSILTLYPENNGEFIHLAGSYELDTWDHSDEQLDIYDGTSTTGTLLYRARGIGQLPSDLVSITGPLTLHFTTENVFIPYGSGLDLTANCVTCAAPHMEANNVVRTSAQIYWTGGSDASFWQIAYGPHGFNPDTVIWLETSNHYYTLTNLTGNTQYDCYVRSYCGDGSYSFWSRVVTFHTLETDVAVLPYFNGFNNPNENVQWVFKDTSYTNTSWYLGIPLTMTDSVLYVSSTNGATTSYVHNSEAVSIWAYRDFMFGDATAFRLSFDWLGMGEEDKDYLEVFIGTPEPISAYVHANANEPANAVSLTGYLNEQTTWQHFTTILDSTYANTIQRIYFLWHNDFLHGDDPSAVIDNFSIIPFSCQRPTALAASNVTHSSCDISFTPGNAGDDEWEYAICASGINPDNIVPTTVTSNPFQITGLQSSTNYYIYVRTRCNDGGYSLWSDALSVTTTCGSIETIPYINDFETVVSLNGTPFVNCWNRFTTNSQSNITVMSGDGTTPGVTVNHALSFPFDANPITLTAVLPEIGSSLNLTDLSVNFNIKTLQLNDILLMLVGVMTDPNDASTFEVVDTIYKTDNEWESFIVPLTNYTGSGRYVALRSFGSSIRMDDLTIDQTLTCLSPRNVSATNITDSSATVVWTDRSAAAYWTIEYGETGFTPGTGTIVTVTTNPATITGLQALLSYDVYVRANCTDNDSSSYSAVHTFSTPLCNVADRCSYTVYLRNNNMGNWYEKGIEVRSNGVLIDFLHITTQHDEVHTISLCDGMIVEFSWADVFGVSYGSFDIYDHLGDLVYSCPDANEMPPGLFLLDTMDCSIPSCLHPMNVNVTENNGVVVVSWTEMGSATAWNIEYGPTGFAHGSGTVVSANTNPYSLQGLPPTTTYDFYVRANCGNGDLSTWSNAVTFTTDCGIINSFPHTEDFELVPSAPDYLPVCWSEDYIPHNAVSWGLNASQHHGISPLHSGSHCAILAYSQNPQSMNFHKLISPIIDFTDYSNPMMKFWHAQESWIGDVDFLHVYYRNNPNDDWTELASYTSAINNWTLDSLTLPNPSSTYQIAFAGEMNWGYGILIDDITIFATPDSTITERCFKPAYVSYASRTDNSIDLSWVEIGTATEWEIEYGPTGFALGSGTNITVTDNPFTIIGLAPYTYYDFYVRAICSDTSSSVWSDVSTIATECGKINTFPYLEDFENSGHLPDCWTINYIQNPSYSYDWECTAGAGSPAIISAHSGDYNAYLRSNIVNQYVTNLVTPIMDLTQISNPYITYWHAQQQYPGGSHNVLKVYYRTSPSNDWVQLMEYPSNYDTWTFDSLALPNPTGTYQIAFEGNMVCQGFPIVLDDILINGDPVTCVVPTNVTASNIDQSSATITWTANGDESAWNLQYKMAADEVWSNDIDVNNTPTYNLTGLAFNTAYDVRVRAVCSSTNISAWATVSFTTLEEATCPTPTNLTVTDVQNHSAVVDWEQEANTASSWNVFYRQSISDEWISVATTVKPYTLTNLAGLTTYDVAVEALCDNGLVSELSEPAHFTTTNVGINDYDISGSIRIFPNPTTGQFTIHNAQCLMKEVNIFDVYGKLMDTMKVEDSDITLDISAYAGGVYFVRVFTENGVVTKRIVKK